MRIHWILATLLGFSILGCGPTELQIQLVHDSDGDGISDAEEEAMKTRDSDGDGFFDLEEIEGNTDPHNPTDHPYPRGWPIDACRNDIQSSGHAVGQIAENFELKDQDGNTVRLHDFCGQVVLLASSAFW